ncbi:IS3 family transposase [Metabacillus herbersteinensis]|uniref:IS3 family transposase n=1 Tax=Metabacillus herbersteinensis TaxID=283816 RepID=A0ABV6GID2_9BACI
MQNYFLRKEYSIVLLCRVLRVSKSGYYAHYKRPTHQAPKQDRKLLTQIKRIYSLHKGTYGAKRISQKLKAKGQIVKNK